MSKAKVDAFVSLSEKHEKFSENIIIEVSNKLPDLSSSSTSSSIIPENGIEDEKQKESCVVDVNFDGENVCRICHLNSEEPSLCSPRIQNKPDDGTTQKHSEVVLNLESAKSDLIRLGCGCKAELSVAHLDCAEAWFKLKGNRVCEICGQTVTNIRGDGNESFMEEWKDGRSNGNSVDSSETSEEEGWWHGQPLCNFLMACLVIAFVIPWFFHINFWS